MKKTRYIPPEVGGEVELTISAELAKLFLGFIGTISGKDLNGLNAAADVREEISEVHQELTVMFGSGSAYANRAHYLRFGQFPAGE